ncbi:DnaD and phage-associated domain-containing protein [Desulfonispora thiosulfatigenes DSM 11270]|uniref:DnaD and phage-associated domain-containing protein n=1 Tax=Desulfonispora thiosulfatigenes DSM 11270 TaxID=656914 RepID=A0A1W1VTM3_DESTI|nr:DnaD domain protein [Desulfonispora thiosulfatigenes]SMB96451.1 DnaD and phage-associated domain-containing protein [Desulfonispora thiosulfatigenes DSM 11270]
MGKQNFTSWFLENGIIGIPKNLIGLMEPLGLTFEDIGKISYILYCGCNQVKKEDSYAILAVNSLKNKGLINWYPDANKVDFSPMYDLISSKLGVESSFIEQEDPQLESRGKDLSYSELIKNTEKKLARFLSAKEKMDIQKVVQRYNWSNELVYEIFVFYQLNLRKNYAFLFFAQMVFGAKVEDKESLKRFIENLNYTSYKVSEIKKRLGQRNNPTEVEKECYLKWSNEWKFSHEMVLRAVEQTIYASDPSFKYIDSILENWYKEGIMNTDKLIESQKEREQQKQNKKYEKKNIKENQPKENQNVIRDLDYLVE